MDDLSDKSTRLISAYPMAETGHRRWVIWLEPRADRSQEANLLLQVRVGLEVEIDGVNRYGLIGQLSNHQVEGWGYNFYRYEGQPVTTSTRIAKMGFGTEDKIVWTVPTVIPYNSRLPVVLYTPEQMQVSHRVLEALSRYEIAATG